MQEKVKTDIFLAQGKTKRPNKRHIRMNRGRKTRCTRTETSPQKNGEVTRGAVARVVSFLRHDVQMHVTARRTIETDVHSATAVQHRQ